MPKCIYCLKEKLADAFANEHVLTRAFCGQGNNWTLVELVCKQCNGELSKFESHWASAAIESIMRNFSGPRGRASGRASRAQPVEIDELYLVQGDDPLVYEAGFAFPSEFYFRPQIVESADGLVGVAANQSEGDAIAVAIDRWVHTIPISLIEAAPEASAQRYRVTTIRLNTNARRHEIENSFDSAVAEGIWLRRIGASASFDDRKGRVRPITRRIALDDRGRLYMRAADLGDATAFFDRFMEPPAMVAENRQYRSDEQLIRPSVQVKLPVVFRCVLKTGLNLVAHTFGARTAYDPAFDELRAELFAASADSRIMQRCHFLHLPPWWSRLFGRDDFPLPPDDSQHRMMLDIHRGKLRFRLRLFGHLGYVGYLGAVTATLRERIAATRIIVDYRTTGIRQVPAWNKQPAPVSSE